MTIEEIRAALDEALELRPPRFGPDEQPRRKVAALEAHLLACAYANAECVRARHWLRTLRSGLAEEWEGLQGWEVAVLKPRGRTTAADIERAKITVARTQHEAIHEAKRLAESVDDQIARFEREERVMSRAYSMIAG